MATTGAGPRADAAWVAAWRELAGSEPMGLHEQMVASYAEPARWYHTGQHLAECFEQLAEVREHIIHPAEIDLALWFHDAVYDPHRSDNEAQSAAWARRALTGAGVDPATTDRVVGLIRATEHTLPRPEGDAAWLVDVDLAILGAPAERFDEYEAQVRREYAFVADEVFRVGRARILQAFLDRPAIYATALMGDRFESAARANLRRSLRQLTSSGPALR